MPTFDGHDAGCLTCGRQLTFSESIGNEWICSDLPGSICNECMTEAVRDRNGPVYAKAIKEAQRRNDPNSKRWQIGLFE